MIEDVQESSKQKLSRRLVVEKGRSRVKPIGTHATAKPDNLWKFGEKEKGNE